MQIFINIMVMACKLKRQLIRNSQVKKWDNWEELDATELIITIIMIEKYNLYIKIMTII